MMVKAGRMVALVFLAVSLFLSAVPAVGSRDSGSLAAEMASVAQLCIGDGGGSGGG